MATEERYIPTTDAARMTGLSRRALTKRAAAGNGPRFRRDVNGHYWFREADVRRLATALEMLAEVKASAQAPE